MRVKYTIISLMAFLCGLGALWAQEATSESPLQHSPKRIIQFSGIVLGPDSLTGLPGVHIYVPGSGRGTTTNLNGFFTMPTLAGDAVAITAVGFKPSGFVIPDQAKENFTVALHIEEDTLLLPNLQIMSYPTEDELKRAVLAYSPISPRDIYDSYWMASVTTDMPMGLSMNHRYQEAMGQQYWNDQFAYRSTNFINPFAWARFIRQLRND